MATAPIPRRVASSSTLGHSASLPLTGHQHAPPSSNTLTIATRPARARSATQPPVPRCPPLTQSLAHHSFFRVQVEALRRPGDKVPTSFPRLSRRQARHRPRAPPWPPRPSLPSRRPTRATLPHRNFLLHVLQRKGAGFQAYEGDTAGRPRPGSGCRSPARRALPS